MEGRLWAIEKVFLFCAVVVAAGAASLLLGRTGERIRGNLRHSAEVQGLLHVIAERAEADGADAAFVRDLRGVADDYRVTYEGQSLDDVLARHGFDVVRR